MHAKIDVKRVAIDSGHRAGFIETAHEGRSHLSAYADEIRVSMASRALYEMSYYFLKIDDPALLNEHCVPNIVLPNINI